MNTLSFMRNMVLPGGYPPYIIFFVTARCNLKCKHCFYWQDLNTQKNELTLSEIEKISQSLPYLFFIRLTGGEPFLRPDFYQVIGLFYKNSSIRRVGISTNGFATEQIADVISRAVNNLRGLSIDLSISIDNLAEKHDALRGCPGAFDRAIKTYKELAKIRTKNSSLKLGFLITLMNSNQTDLESIFNYLRSKQPDAIGVNMIRGAPALSSQLAVDVDEYDRFRLRLNEYNFNNCNRLFSLNKMRITKTVMAQDIIINTVKKKKPQFKCLAADKIAVLYSDGDVAPCELLDSRIGNLRDYNYRFPRLWRERRRRDIMRYIKKSGCFCTHECFITASLIFKMRNLVHIAARACLPPRGGSRTEGRSK